MNSSPSPDPCPCAPVRVLVAAPSGTSAALRAGGNIAAAVSIDFVEAAEAAVERAISNDYEVVLLDLMLDGIGAFAAADILRRAGAPGALVAVGEFDAADRANEAFDHCIAAPLSGAAVRSLLGAIAPRPRPAGGLDGDWIRRECADLAAEFRAGLPGTAAALRAALEGRDTEALKSLVHALKGSAGNYGMPEITRRCVEIETRIGQGRPLAATASIESMIEQLEQASGGAP